MLSADLYVTNLLSLLLGKKNLAAAMGKVKNSSPITSLIHKDIFLLWLILLIQASPTST